MTKTTLHITLECNGRSLGLGPGEAVDITKITGLESSEYELGLTDLAIIDGASLDGRHVKARPIHIEASFRSLRDTAEARELLVRFFNPKMAGKLIATIGGRTRSIDYELEGWTLKEQRNLDARVGFIADLICPDPYFLGEEKVLVDGTAGTATGFAYNEGDVEAGWRATFTGACRNPKVKNLDTGEYMAAIVGMQEGSTLTISTEDRRQTITKNGESAFYLIDRFSTPFKFQPGQFTYELTFGEGTPVVHMTFQERFFGI